MTAKCSHWLEETLSCTMISSLRNLLVKYDNLGKALDWGKTLVTIVFSQVDIFKDILLTWTLIIIVGGPDSILRYPTQFTSGIIMLMVANITIPVFISSLYLAINIPFLLFKFKAPRGILAALCILCSGLNPIFLFNRYRSIKHVTEKAIMHKAQSKNMQLPKKIMQNINIPETMKRQEVINTILAQYLKIELGKLSFCQMYYVPKNTMFRY